MSALKKQTVPDGALPDKAADEIPAVPGEKSLADYFGCRCGDRRNLSIEAGIYRCLGCGDEQRAETLESRKAAGLQR